MVIGDDEAWQDYLDTPERDEDEDRRDPRPTFGCACENALIVDTTCASCIEYLRQRDEETNGVPGAIPSREMDSEETVCQRCRRRIRECVEVGDCGRGKGDL